MLRASIRPLVRPSVLAPRGGVMQVTLLNPLNGLGFVTEPMLNDDLRNVSAAPSFDLVYSRVIQARHRRAPRLCREITSEDEQEWTVLDCTP